MSCGPNAVIWMSPEASAVRASAKRWNITISISMPCFAASPAAARAARAPGTLSMPCLIFTDWASAGAAASATAQASARLRIAFMGVSSSHLLYG
jgi:hypothetical protein